MRRRRLLALGTLASGAAVAFATMPAWRPRASRLARRLRPAAALDAKSPPGALAPGDLETMVAFGLVLLPSMGADSEWVRRHVRARAEQIPGMKTEYERCVRALDASGPATSPPFRDRLEAERLAAVDALLPNYAGRPRWRRVAARLLAAPGERALRELVAGDLLAAYYGTRAGWATLGYTHFPGVAATDPLGYAARPTRPA